MGEIDWPGGELRIGEAVIRLDSLRGRCPMTTVDPDTLERDPEVLADIGRRFNGRLALNAEVVLPGIVRIGDSVRFVHGDAKESLVTGRVARVSDECGRPSASLRDGFRRRGGPDRPV